jgi:hypothetical protein
MPINSICLPLMLFSSLLSAFALYRATSFVTCSVYMIFETYYLETTFPPPSAWLPSDLIWSNIRFHEIKLKIYDNLVGYSLFRFVSIIFFTNIISF